MQNHSHLETKLPVVAYQCYVQTSNVHSLSGKPFVLSAQDKDLKIFLKFIDLVFYSDLPKCRKSQGSDS